MREAGRDFPRLAWLNGKNQSSSMGSRKNRPGRKSEIAAATVLNTEVPFKEETTDEATRIPADIA